MAKEIIKPTQKTWWITDPQDGSERKYCWTNIGRVTESGHELETFTTEQSWLDRLTALGIEIQE